MSTEAVRPTPPRAAHSQPAALLRSGFTVRAFVLGLVLVPANAYWIIQMELFRYSAHPTTISLLFNAIFSLLVMHTINLGVRRLWPRAALGQAELLLAYSMVCVGSAVCSHDFLQVLMPHMAYSFYGATPDNHWGSMFNPYLPSWATVQDHAALKVFHDGGDLYRPAVLLAWLGPIGIWIGFIVVLVLALAALNVLLRRQWLEHEHLACPLVRLPVEITAPRGTLLRNPLFWLGFALAAGADAWNSVAFLPPGLPKLPLAGWDMTHYFVGRPWSAVGWMEGSLYPFVIGIGYLMPSDFLFSSWFFFLFWKAERVLGAAVGLDQIAGFPFTNFQAFGAYLLFALSAAWVGRRYLREVWGAIWGRADPARDAREPLGYRSAAVTLAVCVALLLWFSSALGMRLWLAVVFFAMYFVLSLAIDRMRAQFGSPMHDLSLTGPGSILTAVVGTRAFPPTDLTVMGLYQWFNRAYRGHPMPHELEAMKMQNLAGNPGRGLLVVFGAAAAVAAFTGFWTMLHIGSSHGIMTMNTVYTRLGDGLPIMAEWFQSPHGPQTGPLLAVVTGLLFALLLEVMRLRYSGWPFHPLGFAISEGFTIHFTWMPLLVAWLIKSGIVKYGGGHVYQRGVPLFLGLIVGQFTVGSLLNIVSIAAHIPSYQFWQ